MGLGGVRGGEPRQGPETSDPTGITCVRTLPQKRERSIYRAEIRAGRGIYSRAGREKPGDTLREERGNRFVRAPRWLIAGRSGFRTRIVEEHKTADTTRRKGYGMCLGVDHTQVNIGDTGNGNVDLEREARGGF